MAERCFREGPLATTRQLDSLPLPLGNKGGTKPPIVNVPAVGLCIQARLGHVPTGYRLSLARPSLGKPLKPLVLSTITEHIVYAQSRIQ